MRVASSLPLLALLLSSCGASPDEIVGSRASSITQSTILAACDNPQLFTSGLPPSAYSAKGKKNPPCNTAMAGHPPPIPADVIVKQQAYLQAWAAEKSKWQGLPQDEVEKKLAALKAAAFGIGGAP